jgi:hypothetical protein
MPGDRDGPRLDGMLQLAVITPRADNDPTVSVKSPENVANLHTRISAPEDAERKAPSALTSLPVLRSGRHWQSQWHPDQDPSPVPSCRLPSDPRSAVGLFYQWGLDVGALIDGVHCLAGGTNKMSSFQPASRSDGRPFNETSFPLASLAAIDVLTFAAIFCRNNVWSTVEASTTRRMKRSNLRV